MPTAVLDSVFVSPIFSSSEKSKAKALFKGLVSHKTGFNTQKKAKSSSKKSRNRTTLTHLITVNC